MRQRARRRRVSGVPLRLLGQASRARARGRPRSRAHVHRRRSGFSRVGVATTETDVDRSEKQELVSSLHRTFQDAGLVVVTHQVGLTVSEATDLRRRMRDAGASFKVMKNRLARLALAGTAYEPLGTLFKGPTA